MKVWAKAALVVVGLLLLGLGAPEAWSRMSGKPWDGLVDWWGARAWWEGADPYSAAWLAKVGSEGLGHPPTTSFYALPLALMPLGWMGRILGLISLGLITVELLLLGRELKLPATRAGTVLTLGLLLNTPFLLYHLGIAQVSALIGFFYFLAWRALKHDREVAAGIALGAACSIKLFPGLMVLFLLLNRRWRGVLAAAMTWSVVAAIMTLRFGLHAWTEFAASERRIVDYWIGHASNASVQGIVLRILHPACQGQPITDRTATVIAGAIALVLLISFTLLLRRAKSLDLPFALFVLLSVFANPFYFEHYNVILLLPLALIGAALWRAELPRKHLYAALILLLVVGWCLAVPTNSARVLLAWTLRDPRFHLRAHIEEIRTSLATPLLMLLAALLLRRANSASRLPESR